LREERRLRVFDSGVLRSIFGPKRDEVTGDGRKLHNEELNDLYSSPIIRVIQSRRVTWAGHVASVEERKGACRFWWENLREGDHLEDASIDGKIIVRWIFRKLNVGHRLD
jgi:hypothetical protein